MDNIEQNLRELLARIDEITSADAADDYISPSVRAVEWAIEQQMREIVEERAFRLTLSAGGGTYYAGVYGAVLKALYAAIDTEWTIPVALNPPAYWRLMLRAASVAVVLEPASALTENPQAVPFALLRLKDMRDKVQADLRRSLEDIMDDATVLNKPKTE